MINSNKLNNQGLLLAVNGWLMGGGNGAV